MHGTLRYAIQLKTAPTTFPLSLAEVKLHVGVVDTDDTQDEKLLMLLLAVTTSCERYVRRSFIDTTWTMFLDHFPGRPLPWWSGVRQMANTELTDLTEPIKIPRPPLGSIVSITAHLEDGTTTVVPSTDYVVDTASEPGRVALKSGKSWPTGALRVINGVEVEFIAGWGPTSVDVPTPIRQAILLSISYLRDNPSGGAAKFEKTGESSIARFSPEELGVPALNLLQTYKIWKF